MSSQNLRSSSRFLAIGFAALLMQVGGLARAGQQPDIQQQMQQVLSGHIEAHLTSPAQASRGESSRSTSDSQAFARRLLQGWSVSTAARTRPSKEHHVAANSPKYQDVQAMVRRQLLGA
jgi:hypothetical protein